MSGFAGAKQREPSYHRLVASARAAFCPSWKVEHCVAWVNRMFAVFHHCHCFSPPFLSPPMPRRRFRAGPRSPHLKVCLHPATPLCLTPTADNENEASSEIATTSKKEAGSCAKGLTGPNPRLPSEMPPITPQRSRDDFPSFIASLNQEYSLEIPVPQNWSPISLKRLDTRPGVSSRVSGACTTGAGPD